MSKSHKLIADTITDTHVREFQQRLAAAGLDCESKRQMFAYCTLATEGTGNDRRLAREHVALALQYRGLS